MEKKIKVLIIDDEQDACEFSKSVLEKTGKYEVMVSTCAMEGIALSKKFRPDMILLDVRMPDMDGAEVAARLCEDENTRNATIVFLSAVAIPMALITALVENDNLKQQAQRRGAHYFIQKPVSTKELVERIEAILKG